MYNSEYVYAAIYLIILLASNLLLAKRWAEGGLFVKPLNLGLLTNIGFSLLATCCYSVICIQSYDDVYTRLFYFLIAVFLIPMFWGFVHRFILMKPGLLQLNIALRRMEKLESNSYISYHRSIENEKIIRESKEVKCNIQLIRKSILKLLQEQKTSVLYGEVLLTSDHPDDHGYLTVECLNCSSQIKMFGYAEEDNIDCCCQARVHFVRNDDYLSIKVKLKESIKSLANDNRYYLAMANEMLAQNYRLMGELDQAKSYLDTARFYAGNLHRRFPSNKSYIEILSLIYFRKAQVCFMQNDKANARSYAKESLLLCQKLDDRENIDLIKLLISKC